ncbi:hypothetical protein T492DRAFT_1086000 [Pavlovales sp. CCMP2436]|nr:hypothetical protein T492DRAFT_1086000 [Pavlovales sp. CCMP2436]
MCSAGATAWVRLRSGCALASRWAPKLTATGAAAAQAGRKWRSRRFPRGLRTTRPSARAERCTRGASTCSRGGCTSPTMRASRRSPPAASSRWRGRATGSRTSGRSRGRCWSASRRAPYPSPAWARACASARRRRGGSAPSSRRAWSVCPTG